MGDSLGRYPNMDCSKYLHFIYWAVCLAPFEEFEPRQLGRNVMDTADKRETCRKDAVSPVSDRPGSALCFGHFIDLLTSWTW